MNDVKNLPEIWTQSTDIDLKKPLAWTKASPLQKEMLQNLQGNILKGHGRDETVNVFFKLDAAAPRKSRRALREIANYHVTSALRQLEDTRIYHKSGKSGGPFVGLYLSATGYSALDASALAPTSEPQFFGNGMRDAANAAEIGDNLADWQYELNQQIDGMVLIGAQSRTDVDFKRDDLVQILENAGATIVFEQIGSAVRNRANDGIEHFGYVDGRSQPLLLQEDIDRETNDAGTSRWNAAFGLEAALVKDPAGGDDKSSYGSYFIFRKLEQNVRAFKRREQELADALNLAGAEPRELAGAIVVGRFEDGTPVTMSDEAKGANPPNDFNYEGDSGSRCPFHAHIRKVNPRHDEERERSHIMPRRGIPFTEAKRAVHPSDIPGSDSLQEFDSKAAPLLPTGDVGLLFMAFNSSLTNQFVFTQKLWANNARFPQPGVGVDPIIGQGADASLAQQWPNEWDQEAGGAKTDFNFASFVTMRGGEYFFAPSLTFFKNL